MACASGDPPDQEKSWNVGPYNLVAVRVCGRVVL